MDVDFVWCVTDLTPLAYVAGAVTKHPHIRVHTPAGLLIRASETDLPPIALQPKEQLGLMNGTAFSAAVGALASHDAVHLALLAQVCTALGTEALLGTQANHVPFIHDECRPHAGQVSPNFSIPVQAPESQKACPSAPGDFTFRHTLFA